MGCASGFCGVPRRANAAAASMPAQQNAGACCSDCADDTYRRNMSAMFNPWRNAGADPTAGSGVDSTPITDWKGADVQPGPLPGTQMQTQDAGGYNLALQALNQGIQTAGQIATQQQRNDSALALQQANLNAQAAQRQALANRGVYADTSTGGSSSGNGTLLLGLGALAAAVLSGLVKLPR